MTTPLPDCLDVCEENRPLERAVWRILCQRFPWLNVLPTREGLPIIADADRATFIACIVDLQLRDLAKAIFAGEADDLVSEGGGI